MWIFCESFKEPVKVSNYESAVTLFVAAVNDPKCNWARVYHSVDLDSPPYCTFNRHF